MVDSDVIMLSEGLKSAVTNKLGKVGEVFYAYGAEDLGPMRERGLRGGNQQEVRKK